MIRLTPLLFATSLVVTGAFGFQEFRHQDATLYVHQEPAGTVDNLTGQASMTRASSKGRMKLLNTRSTPSKLVI